MAEFTDVAPDTIPACVFESTDSLVFLVDRFNRTESMLGSWPRDWVVGDVDWFATEVVAVVDWLLSDLVNNARSYNIR